MAVTIANLEYQSDTVFLRSILINTNDWLRNVSVVEGLKGVARIADFIVPGDLLVALTCTPQSKNFTVNGKDVDVTPYNFSIPVQRCDLHETWLAHFARTYDGAEEVFYENLMPYVAEQIGDEIKTKAIAALLTEATADVNVAKIAVTPLVSTPAGAKATIISFISGMSDAFLKKAFENYWWSNYSVYVSPEVYSLYLLSDNATTFIGGLYLEADSTLTGDQMYCTPSRNILVAFDSTEDVNQFKVVPKQELNTDYIVGGVSFGASYLDSKRLVISS